MWRRLKTIILTWKENIAKVIRMMKIKRESQELIILCLSSSEYDMETPLQLRTRTKSKGELGRRMKEMMTPIQPVKTKTATRIPMTLSLA